jgi:hypothetical protein
VIKEIPTVATRGPGREEAMSGRFQGVQDAPYAIKKEYHVLIALNVIA